MNRKGISPLIAAVLLIAFTMAVAAILTAWVTTFTGRQTSAVGNQSEEIIQCSYAGLNIEDAIYNSTNSWKLQVTLSNTGRVDFNNISVHAFQDGNHQLSKYTGALNQGGMTSVEFDLNNTSPQGKPTKVKAISQNCPSKSDQVSEGDIQ